MKNKWILAILFIMLISTVSAASSVITDKLNFWDSETHTVIITNDEGVSVDLNATMPAGFVFDTSSDCTNPSGQIVYCAAISDDSSATFTMTSPSSGVGEYEVLTLTSTAGATSLSDIKFVRIKDEEIFLTLVEYGRGKGNYFYSSQGRGGSGQQATGYAYIPTNTHFELNFLHKLYPTIGNYLSVPTAEGEGLSITCTYPNVTLLKHHLATDVTLGNPVEIDYTADLLTTSWERLMWAVQSFDAGVYSDGNTITINCTNIHYYLPEANGNISISEDSFTLEFATKTPVTISASSDPGTINNGTSEVDITYVVTNTEGYPLSVSSDPLYITLLSPDGADFIGVKGELWGTSLDEYDLEIPNLDAGETYTITLTTRFDTSSMTATSVNLSRGAEVQFVPSWEINSYNPMSITQDVLVTDTITIDYGSQSNIVGVIDRIEEINQTTQSILLDTIEINNTINTLEQYLIDINGTVTTIKTTTDNIYIDTQNIYTDTQNIYVDTQAIYEQLNCDTVSDSPLCGYANDINNSVSSISSDLTTVLNFVTEINETTWTTYNTMEQNFTDVFTQLTTIEGDITTVSNNVNLALQYLNCTIDSEDSVCYRLNVINTTINSVYADTQNIYSDTQNIYTDTQNIYVDTQYITNTQLPNINSSIINALSNINLTGQLEPVLTKIRQLKEFEEESIYLITDSMIEAADNAMKSIDNGDISKSVEYLEQTQTLLNELNVKIDETATLKTNAIKVENGIMTSTIQSQGLLERIMNWLTSLFSL